MTIDRLLAVSREFVAEKLNKFCEQLLELVWVVLQPASNAVGEGEFNRTHPQIKLSGVYSVF